MDLTKINTRQVEQRRVTDNTKGILPARRNTDAAQLERFADMRSARRGDVGGAEQLMSLFGDVQRAAAGVAQYADQRFEADERTNAAEGAVDAVTGDMDPVQAERSRAYNVAYTRGRAERDTLTFVSDLDKKVQERLNDPENPADQDDVDELIAEAYKGYLQPEGTPRNFGSDEARLAAVSHLQRGQEAMRLAALARIRAQVNEESLTNAAEVYRLQLERGSRTSFKDAYANLVPGVDRNEARGALITATLTYAQSVSSTNSTRALEVIDQLLASDRGLGEADGTLRLSVADRARITQFRTRLSGEIRQEQRLKEAERQGQNAGRLVDRFGGIGIYPTADEIRQMRLRGELTAKDAFEAISTLRRDADRARAHAERIEDNARQDRAEARASAALAAEERTNRRINALLAPVHRGQRSTSEAYRLLLDEAWRIPDREERQALMGAVRSELEALGEARERTPEFMNAMDRLQSLQQRMITSLPSNLRGERRDLAVKQITEAIEREVVRIGRRARDQGTNPSQLMDEAERSLTDRYVRGYHR